MPCDPDRPKLFVAARLAHNDGALIIGQTDYHLSDKIKPESGVWRYIARLPELDRSQKSYDQGLMLRLILATGFPKQGRPEIIARIGTGTFQIQCS